MSADVIFVICLFGMVVSLGFFTLIYSLVEIRLEYLIKLDAFKNGYVQIQNVGDNGKRWWKEETK